MKRSTALKLVLMAYVGVSLVSIFDEEEEKAEGKVFSSKEECTSSEQFSEGECSEAFKTATDIDSNSAPRYDSQRLCEEQHGAYSCKPSYNQDGSSFFAPLAAGYFIGKATSGSSDWGNRVRPVYTNQRRTKLYTGDGNALDISSNSNSAKVSKTVISKPPKAAKVQTRTTVASRGGFGSRSGRSSGG